MAKVKTNENTRFYKSMTLMSNNLVIEVAEKTPDKRGEISLYHSPAKFRGDRFHAYFADRKELKDYIKMLQDFDNKFGNYLDQVQAPNNIKGGENG